MNELPGWMEYIEDARQQRKVRHSVKEILVIVLFAQYFISGLEQDIELSAARPGSIGPSRSCTGIWTSPSGKAHITR